MNNIDKKMLLFAEHCMVRLMSELNEDEHKKLTPPHERGVPEINSHQLYLIKKILKDYEVEDKGKN